MICPSCRNVIVIASDGCLKARTKMLILEPEASGQYSARIVCPSCRRDVSVGRLLLAPEMTTPRRSQRSVDLSLDRNS